VSIVLIICGVIGIVVSIIGLIPYAGTVASIVGLILAVICIILDISALLLSIVTGVSGLTNPSFQVIKTGESAIWLGSLSLVKAYEVTYIKEISGDYYLCNFIVDDVYTGPTVNSVNNYIVSSSDITGCLKFNNVASTSENGNVGFPIEDVRQSTVINKR